MADGKLPWKYCECGCHGNELSVGGAYFWCLTEFPRGVFDTSGEDGGPFAVHKLYDAHRGWGKLLEQSVSWKEIERKARNILEARVAELKVVLE